MNSLYFITGTGTDVGKTVAAAVFAESIGADYWKPVQAGYESGTDTEWIASRLSNGADRVHPELYKLKIPASPHIAAREENIRISLEKIGQKLQEIQRKDRALVIEGAGGLLVPLNETEFVSDLIDKLKARVVLVSRNYLGSINHSLLTANICRQLNLPVAGWIFNDHFMNYEEEIENWSGYPALGKLPYLDKIDNETIQNLANGWKLQIQSILKHDQI